MEQGFSNMRKIRPAMQKQLFGHLLLVFLFGILHLSSSAQNVEFEAVVNKNQVRLGEHFEITFQVNANFSNFKHPSFKDFRVLSGPNQSQGIQMINGHTTINKSVSFILTPTKEGKFTIGEASATIEGKNYTTKPIVISVSGGPQNSSSTPNQPSSQPQTANSGSEISDNIFIKCLVSNKNPFIGESITATYKIYFRLDIVNNELAKSPNYNGFWTQEVDLPDNVNVSTETINGIAFRVATLKKVILYPQRTGKLVVEPLALNVILRLRDNRRPRSVFDSFFGSYKDVSYLLESDSSLIQVKPLPEANKPKNFSGAVGDFTATAQLDKNQVNVNDAVNFTLKIKGEGNLKLFDLPKVELPADFEIYDPKTNDKIFSTDYGLKGSKSEEYLMIPRYSGSYTIPEFSFSYFNPKTEKYTTTNLGPFTIEVAAPNGEVSNRPGAINNNYAPVQQQNIKQLNTDIRFIKTKANLVSEGTRFFGSLSYYALLLLPALLYFVFYFYYKRVMPQASSAEALAKRAKKNTLKVFAQAEKELKNNNIKAFRKAYLDGISAYFAQKMQTDLALVTKDSIKEFLAGKVHESDVQELFQRIEEQEMAQYVGVASINNEESIKAIKELITRIDSQISQQA